MSTILAKLRTRTKATKTLKPAPRETTLPKEGPWGERLAEKSDELCVFVLSSVFFVVVMSSIVVLPFVVVSSSLVT
jgi:hypothetical protein